MSNYTAISRFGAYHHDMTRASPRNDYFHWDDANFRHCRGNLIVNGGFENPDPLSGWHTKGDVRPADVISSHPRHQGNNMISLGLGPNSSARHDVSTLSQIIHRICPHSFYQLNFYMNGQGERTNGKVLVLLRYLDARKDIITPNAIEFFIPAESLPPVFNGIWTGFLNITKFPAPHRAHFAELIFKIWTGENWMKHVHVDDVSLVAL